MSIVTFYRGDPNAPKTTMPAHLGVNAIIVWDGKLLLERRRDSGTGADCGLPGRERLADGHRYVWPSAAGRARADHQRGIQRTAVLYKGRTEGDRNRGHPQRYCGGFVYQPHLIRRKTPKKEEEEVTPYHASRSFREANSYYGSSADDLDLDSYDDSDDEDVFDE